MAKQAPAPKEVPPENFEAALDELERIVQTMEEGELSLENSLAAYQRGVTLLKFCRQRLDSAEQTIQVLENGQLQAAPADLLSGGEE